MPNSGHMCFTVLYFNMVFDTIGRYEFDTLWIWGYDFDLVLLCLWYGLGFGLDMVLECFGCEFNMVWERSAFFRVPDGLASRKETETVPGQPFGRCLDCFCGFEMILIQFWYVDMILIIFFDTVPRNPTQLSPYKTSKTQPAITALTHIDPYQNHSWNRNHIKIMTAKQGHKQIITIKHVWIAPKSLKITNLQKPPS